MKASLRVVDIGIKCIHTPVFHTFQSSILLERIAALDDNVWLPMKDCAETRD